MSNIEIWVPSYGSCTNIVRMDGVKLHTVANMLPIPNHWFQSHFWAFPCHAILLHKESWATLGANWHEHGRLSGEVWESHGGCSCPTLASQYLGSDENCLPIIWIAWVQPDA